MKLIIAILLTLFSLSAHAGRDTETVWSHHIEAWEKRDLNAIVSDYDENSVLIVNGETFRGNEEIKFVFSRLFEIFDRGVNQIHPVVLTDRLVFITWHFAPNGRQAIDGTDTFFIEDGVIRFQTIASRLYEIFPLKTVK